uniref:Ribosomal protein L16 n=1 Tax=Gelidiella acerosa TaxID=28867 RepID=A0A7G9IVN6_9FLOR|nr:ribosomal protein L16 [Gelidiella acerosa]QNM39430.1 ribosomal protein L16 [Gelidiella acerosa]
MQIKRKTHNKEIIRGKKNFQFLNSGILGVKTISSGRLIESNWITIKRDLYKKIKFICGGNRCKLWNSIEFNNTLTKLSTESRMGKGKGSIYANSKFIREGKVIIEFSQIPKHKHKELLSFLQKKLSLKIKLIHL